MSNVELIGSFWTLAGGAFPPESPPPCPEYCPFDLRERIEAASKAGFTGMGFWHTDLQNIVKTHTFEEMRTILEDNGIVNIEVEFLLDWFLDGERGQAAKEMQKFLMETAETLGANHIKIGDFSNEECSLDKKTERFVEICTDARERGFNILYEILPKQFSKIHSLDTGLELTRGAGMANGGLMLDIWHNVRNGTTNQEMIDKLGPDDLIGAELNDGLLAVPDDMLDATINHRLLVGEGEFDVRGFIDALTQVGYDGPYGIEVLNAEIRQWPLDKIATQAFDTTTAVFS